MEYTSSGEWAFLGGIIVLTLIPSVATGWGLASSRQYAWAVVLVTAMVIPAGFATFAFFDAMRTYGPDTWFSPGFCAFLGYVCGMALSLMFLAVAAPAVLISGVVRRHMATSRPEAIGNLTVA